MAVYSYDRDLKAQAGNTQQAQNQLQSSNYYNQASQGQFPYAQQGSQIASQTGAASAGATAQKAPAQQQQPQTFAQLQQAGYARPAPPMQALTMAQPGGLNIPGGTPTGGQPDALQQAIAQLLANPDPYGEEALQRQFQRGSEQIDDDYKRSLTGINEEMARRGIYDSTITGGRMADTAVARKSAQTDLMERLASQRAQGFADRRNQAIQLAMGNDQWRDQMMQNLLQLFGADPTQYDLSGMNGVYNYQPTSPYAQLFG